MSLGSTDLEKLQWDYYKQIRRTKVSKEMWKFSDGVDKGQQRTAWRIICARLNGITIEDPLKGYVDLLNLLIFGLQKFCLSIR